MKDFEMLNMEGKEIPKTVYKYRDWKNEYHRKILLHQEIYIPSPSKFNDPFDCRPVFSNDIVKNNEIIEKQHKLFGVFSVTAKNNNVLMWAHYANEHQGFCVGFDSYKLFNLFNSGRKKLNYEDKYPVISSTDDRTLKIIKMFYTKAKYWKYEEEYRLLKADYSNISEEIDKEIITEIILGYKMSTSDRRDILKLISLELPHVKVYEAKPKFKSFELEIKLIL